MNMNTRTLLSIVFSSVMLGGVVVLLVVREPTIPLILLAIGVTGQLVTKLGKAAKNDATEKAGAGSGDKPRA